MKETFEPGHSIFYKIALSSSEISDQTERNQISLRIRAVYLRRASCGYKTSSGGQGILPLVKDTVPRFICRPAYMTVVSGTFTWSRGHGIRTRTRQIGAGTQHFLKDCISAQRRLCYENTPIQIYIYEYFTNKS